jgi:CheY-like chemotaxis protein
MKSPTSLRALCVDDDDDNREVLAILLQCWGLEVDAVANASDAVLLSKARHFDLYLLDSWLPDLDGLELCRRVRAADPEAQVLFYSGAGYEADKREAIEAGANGYVVKPDVDELQKVLTNMVSSAKRALASRAPC